MTPEEQNLAARMNDPAHRAYLAKRFAGTATAQDHAAADARAERYARMPGGIHAGGSLGARALEQGLARTGDTHAPVRSGRIDLRPYRGANTVQRALSYLGAQDKAFAQLPWTEQVKRAGTFCRENHGKILFDTKSKDLMEIDLRGIDGPNTVAKLVKWLIAKDPSWALENLTSQIERVHELLSGNTQIVEAQS